MKYRVHMSCWDGVERHYYTTEIEGKDRYDATHQARIEYAKSENYPERLKKDSLESKVEAPHIHWAIEINNNHLYPDDFKFTKSDWSGWYVSFDELCKMIKNGVITVNRNKINN